MILQWDAQIRFCLKYTNRAFELKNEIERLIVHGKKVWWMVADSVFLKVYICNMLVPSEFDMCKKKNRRKNHKTANR